MTTRDFTSLPALIRAIESDLKKKERNVKAAMRKAAREGAAHIKKAIPVAHGELRESVHAQRIEAGALIVVDAPHAAAVNNGSRPHTPPLEPLIAWVKLRGMQGLATDRQIGRLPGTSTGAAARSVAAMLASKQHRGPAGFSDIDAAEQVARAIQFAIAKRGTKPHHFIEKSLPWIRAYLDRALRGPIDAPELTGGDGLSGSKGTTKSGAYRKHSDTYHGKKIQTDEHGRKFVDQKKGRVYLRQ